MCVKQDKKKKGQSEQERERELDFTLILPEHLSFVCNSVL